MSALRKGFERCGNKVSLGQFIALVLPLLPDNVPRGTYTITLIKLYKKTMENRPQSLAEDWTIRLMDIFDEIDINGDGAMEWDEFTLFCIHNAVAATRREESKVPHIRVSEARLLYASIR